MKDKINPTHGKDTHDALDEVWQKITAEATRIGMDDTDFFFTSITPLEDFGDRSLMDLVSEGDVENLTRFYELVKAEDDAVLGTDDGSDSVAV